MLEVRNLKKEYKTKNGVVTKALDDVSLTFPETGMVFILGKSGSGKSTLLNVCGGLDKADSGEIVIKGKSSKEFSGSDFDSYRNTFVGFVFQEYNILDEFTVEQNIALALELQNKKRDKAIIDKILDDVDMTSFASRKPNTLSGGQKQRVAIARALVKEPQIIMADEPTGALDSKTGQQVFDTLKKLSKEKLVIVISHDRDFAEQYGDRIIELKDGKILSDQTRAPIDAEHQNVKFFGTDVVSITNGAELTDDDLQSIKKFLNKSGGSAVISTSREQITQMQQDRPEIDVGAFENIKEQPKSKEYPKQKLIRSHLPVRHAIKMGGSSLKTKPVRLMFTILLSLVAFILFGLVSTLMMFDGHDVTVQTFMDSGINYINLGKEYFISESYDDDDGENTFEYTNSTVFTDEEYNEYLKKYGNAIRSVDANGLSVDNVTMTSYVSSFYGPNGGYRINGYIPATAALDILAGELPSADDEIMITDFMFDGLKASGTKFKKSNDSNAQTVTVSDYSSVLYRNCNAAFIVSGKKYKIVGVFKGMVVPADYKSMKESADKNEQNTNNGMGLWLWQTELENGLYNRIAVTEDFFETVAESGGNNDSIDVYRYFKRSGDELDIRTRNAENQDNNGDNVRLYMLADYSESGNKLKIYGLDGTAKTSVGKVEVYLSDYTLVGLYKKVYNDFVRALEMDQSYGDMLSQKRGEAELEYSLQHRMPEWHDEKYFNKTQYDKDVADWESAFNAWQKEPGNEGETEYEYEYSTGNYRPYKEDDKYYDSEQYQIDSNEYHTQRNEYIESEVNKYRKNGAYLELAEQLKKEYLEENPEPDRETDDQAYWDWYYRMQEQCDPITRMSFAVNAAEFASRLKTVVGLFDQMGVPAFDLEIGNESSGYSAMTLGGYFMGGSNCSSAAYLGTTLYNTYYFATNDWSSNASLSTKYETPDDAYINRIFIPYGGDSATIDEVLNTVGVRAADDSIVNIGNSVMTMLNNVIELADTLKKAFVIAGVVFALFAFLLMFNFISASITAKKKEIGILRAIGARITDVFKIFISEAFIIALICFVLAMAGSWGLCTLLNSIILEDMGMSMSLFVFGPISILFILAIALVTALVSTVLPVALYSRKPPVDSIRAL